MATTRDWWLGGLGDRLVAYAGSQAGERGRWRLRSASERRVLAALRFLDQGD